MADAKQNDSTQSEPTESKAHQSREASFYEDHQAPAGYEVQVVGQKLEFRPIKDDSK